MSYKLSRREWLCLRMFAGGMRTIEIAQSLGVGIETIRSYMGRGRGKLRKNGIWAVSSSIDLNILVEQGGLEWTH
jgi:transposase